MLVSNFFFLGEWYANGMWGFNFGFDGWFGLLVDGVVVVDLVLSFGFLRMGGALVSWEDDIVVNLNKKDEYLDVVI